eukprot:GILJ01019428.1.p1 GENE.GILJ01019428.1~~GILJ01019428.1.p1  ORF type:complete len:315 (+),score=30.19 GILJ01019428.1:297-1241(+)
MFSSDFTTQKPESHIVNSRNFGLEILAPGSKLVLQNEVPHMVAPNNTRYKIKLYSALPQQSSVQLSVDGASIGTFHLRGNSNYIIERPVQIEQALVFVDSQSKQAAASGIQPGLVDNGWIVAEFRPQRYKISSTHFPLCSSQSSQGGGCRYSPFGLSSSSSSSRGTTPFGASSTPSLFGASAPTSIGTPFGAPSTFGPSLFGASTSPSPLGAPSTLSSIGTPFGASASPFGVNHNQRSDYHPATWSGSPTPPTALATYNNWGEGATELGDRCQQQFHEMPLLTDIDESMVTSIKIRMVVARDPRPVSLRSALSG